LALILSNLNLLLLGLEINQCVCILLQLPTIKELHLTQCKNVTNATLKLLATHTELEVLSVSSIPMITDNGLIPIAQNCTQLRVLDMHRLDGVTGTPQPQLSTLSFSISHLLIVLILSLIDSHSNPLTLIHKLTRTHSFKLIHSHSYSHSHSFFSQLNFVSNIINVESVMIFQVKVSKSLLKNVPT
jgi:hypothetical protein